jgi:hypothetical protein
MSKPKAGELTAEQLRLLKIGHCPWDAERSTYDEEAEQVVHCHADSDGDCNWAYCPQPLLRASALAASALVTDKVRTSLAKEIGEAQAWSEYLGGHGAAKIREALEVIVTTWDDEPNTIHLVGRLSKLIDSAKAALGKGA